MAGKSYLVLENSETGSIIDENAKPSVRNWKRASLQLLPFVKQKGKLRSKEILVYIVQYAIQQELW